MHLINISQFINSHITKREVSFFDSDIQKNIELLSSKIEGKSILIIGGAGTIGSSYIKAILRFKPGKLVVVDTNENGLTELTRDLRSTFGQYVPEDYTTYPMNFSDPVFEKMFLAHKPFHVVANFAAHKHVRSEKDQFSIEAMIENNVMRAKYFLDLLLKNKPEHFFCVSTDKAANPVNVMGASKKLMEEVIMAYSKELNITTARFANVAFSNGSLLDGYIQRIFKSQPISCPSDVKRFFVSPEESGQICMLACLLGQSGDIFFPKLAPEEMVNFKDITLDFFNAMGRAVKQCSSEEEAKQLAATLSDTDPYPAFFFASNTSGEKLYEEFYTDEDIINWGMHKSLGIIKNSKRMNLDEVNCCLKEIKTIFFKQSYSKEDIIIAFKKYLPQFQHIETGRSLDSNM
jgi:FlaA1/EpsC-like NDP-sugar epimerase